MRDASISIAVSSKVVKNLELLSRSEIPKFRKFRISLFRNLTEVLGKGYFYYFEFPLKAMEPYFHTRLVYVRSNHRINNPVLSITSRYLIYELWPSHLLDYSQVSYLRAVALSLFGLGAKILLVLIYLGTTLTITALSLNSKYH